MPRIRRTCPTGSAHHVINRGNNRRTIFQKSGDYRAFLELMREAQERVPMPVLSYCLMPNHFHFVLWPGSVKALSAYMMWLMNAHVRQYHTHYETCGTGHIYQGRFKNFPIQTGCHLLAVVKYVEGNALRAGLVPRAEDWRWSSLADDDSVVRPAITPLPMERPRRWREWVNETLGPEAVQEIRRSVRRGTPFGSDEWVAAVAKAHGLEFMLRRPGRPRNGDTQLFAAVSDSAKS